MTFSQSLARALVAISTCSRQAAVSSVSTRANALPVDFSTSGKSGEIRGNPGGNPEIREIRGQKSALKSGDIYEAVFVKRAAESGPQNPGRIRGAESEESGDTILI
jgi:hypothetical protein